ncbi:MULTISPECIES: DUF3313 family protein [Colwellia]|uniref:Putative lipoprotein n=1 Tax=Colwellia psychrerythraea (strain 34H / ATCC BAA-681) TaxID=167879 RepID=Q47Z55_COLP3|nr:MULTISPECIES: DUF3313 family protein [Colwellia]AAZ24611.1 putative lipoprotein [Colwellia psychrerythraea 34H]PKH87092.1 DUF3313 domain-containing protein [Colwellia sp. Bg11-28]
MTKQQGLKLSFIALAASLVIGCNSTNPTNAPQVSPEGMELKKSTRSTVAYKKEGVDFSEYDKVQILPSAVAFKKNWKRDYNRDQVSLSTRINDADVIRMKAEMAELFDEVFKEEFGKDANFSLVDKVSSKTLVVRPAIINLDVSAPDMRSAINVKTYADDAGQATLFIELYDGVSGEILARAVNTAVAGDNSYHQWANRVSNRADAKRMIRKWAKALRIKFDEAHMPKTN